MEGWVYLAEKKKERVRKPEEVWKLLTSNCCPMQCMREFAFNDVVSSEASFKKKKHGGTKEMDSSFPPRTLPGL